MSDLISRIEAIREIGATSLLDYESHRAVVEIIETLPSAAPQIVRCEKCIYWDEKTYPSTLSGVLHPCRWWPISTTPLDYCGHGKRRTGHE